MLGTTAPCTHVRAIETPADPHTLRGCEECLATGSRWVHLRCYVDALDFAAGYEPRAKASADGVTG